VNTDDTLRKIDHVVVLMMENRSFDHMLGYLKIDGVMPEADGLAAGMSNEDAAGGRHEVRPLGARLINEKVLDPGHGAKDVAAQLAGGNAGFVKNYAAVLAKNRERYPDYDPSLDFHAAQSLVMGYQRAEDVPVYDYIARNFAVCDRWFSSVPGPTWENRMFALTGGTGERTPLVKIAGNVPKFLEDAPIYDRKAFVRWIDGDDWRWYSHDPATLRAADSRFRPGGEDNEPWDDHFAHFDRNTLAEPRNFLDDAAAGTLPAVSWIDPNFIDLRVFGPPGSNDDHPPSRVMLGQELVLRILQAVATSPLWSRMMFVIVYDEHGGFFDHCPPGDFDVPGDPAASFGVRVPALVVSPYTAQAQVCSTAFDHTSLPKTLLARFSSRADEAFTALGPRTEHAHDLGDLLPLDASEPRDAPSPADLAALQTMVEDWKRRAYEGRLLEEPKSTERLYDWVTDIQRDILGFATLFRRNGLRPGKP
jgi:phospholipase C